MLKRITFSGNVNNSLNNSEGQTQTLSSTQAFSTQAFLAQPMSPILTKTLAAPKIQQNLDNMFLGGTSRKHSEAFKTKTSNKRNTASVTNSNVFQNAAHEISDDSDNEQILPAEVIVNEQVEPKSSSEA